MKRHTFVVALACALAAALVLSGADLAFAATVAGHVDGGSMLSSDLVMRLAEIGAGATAADVKALADKLKDTTTQFNAKSDELTRKAEEALAEVKNKGALVDATKAEVDKLLVEQTVLTAAKNKLETELVETQARLSGVEQELVRRPGNAGQPAAHQSIGAQLVTSDKFKAWRGDANSEAPRGKFRFGVQQALTSVDVPAGIVEPQRVGPIARSAPRLFIRDLINIGQTGAPAIFYVKQTGFTNNAAVVAENTKKPESAIAYEPETAIVRTIAHLFKTSKQILDDFAMLRSDVDREMRFGLKYAEEQEILFGAGTGQHMHGIVPQATEFAIPAGFPVIPNHNRIDDVRISMLQVQLARLPADGIVMHFIDWAGVELTKDLNGQYLFANPLRLAGPNLWGLPVAETENAGFLGSFLTGAFKSGATLYDREEANVEISTENNDDFEKNMITIRCEERAALAVTRPEAFVFGEYTAAAP